LLYRWHQRFQIKNGTGASGKSTLSPILTNKNAPGSSPSHFSECSLSGVFAAVFKRTRKECVQTSLRPATRMFAK
jgi:nitrogen fixation/metabolism regulation signal transduction histidine kinase